ncbi:MAG: SPOR domain-containing protein [Calditrichaeota bacterium]|nr:SPOR domain-containing protein [Calditrichota bacterium]
MVIHFALKIILTGFLIQSPTNDEWLVEQYQRGNLAALKHAQAQYPDTSAAGWFLRGLFESNGQQACLCYENSIALAAGGAVEASALERLYWNYITRGESATADKYLGYLQKRHPSYKMWSLPDVALKSVTLSAPEKSISVETAPFWSVQVGAFANRKSAETLGKSMARFAPVEYISKSTGGKTLIAVRVGRFDQRQRAEELLKQIDASTGITGCIVKINDK